MLRPLLLLFCCISIYWLSAQDLLLRTTESLRSNVVRITVRFQNGNIQHGFGFITGEKNKMLYLATAAHVVYGKSFDQKPSQIQVWFYADRQTYFAEGGDFSEEYDLAILQLKKPYKLQYQGGNWADFSPRYNQAVRFIGREQDWRISVPGEISNFNNERILAYMPIVGEGTSGAPLISEKGIVGLIIEDDYKEVTVIGLSRVREFFNKGGRFSYFNPAPAETPPINNSVIRPQLENDLSTNHMVKIEGGTFRMGCIETRDGSCKEDEVPEHGVNISSFYLGKNEITNAEFVQFLNAINNQIALDANADKVIYRGKVIFDVFCTIKKGGCTGFKEQIEYNAGDRPGGRFTVVAGYEKHPVVMVTKYGAEAYCAWLSNKTGKIYRLPTEAEWEFAARGGINSRRYKYAGSNDLTEVGWYAANSRSTSQPIEQKNANELGLHDLSGNVWEWCSDWYDKGYYKNSPSNNPKGPVSGTSSAVLRGGHWNSFNEYCRLAYRHDVIADHSNYDIGFRIARNL